MAIYRKGEDQSELRQRALDDYFALRKKTQTPAKRKAAGRSIRAMDASKFYIQDGGKKVRGMPYTAQPELPISGVAINISKEKLESDARPYTNMYTNWEKLGEAPEAPPSKLSERKRAFIAGKVGPGGELQVKRVK